MNENLKKILTSIYSNNGNLELIAKEVFCPDIKDNSSTSDILAFLNEEDFTESFASFADFVRYNNNLTNLPGLENLSREQKNNIKTAKTAPELITLIKNICSEKVISIPENFENYYNKLASGTSSKTAMLLACLLISKSTSKSNPMFEKLIGDVIFEIEEKGSVDINKKNILNLIKTLDPSLLVNAEKVLYQYSMLTELAYTPNQASYIKTSINNSYDNSMEFFDNTGTSKNLIANHTAVKDSPSILDAILNFDMEEKSNLIAYALQKIEEKVRETKSFSEQEIQPATELIFLTLCDQCNKEIDNNLLFAFTNPICESMHTSSISYSLDKAKDIIKEISGKEVEYVSDDDKEKELREKEAFLRILEDQLKEKEKDLAKKEEELKEQEKNFEEREKKIETDEEKSDDEAADYDKKDVKKIDNTLKNPKFLKLADVWNYVPKILASHYEYITTEYKNKGKATTKQVNIVSELTVKSISTEEKATIPSKIKKAIESKRSKIKNFSNTDSVNTMMQNLISVVKDIMTNLKNIRAELTKLKNQYNKETDEDKKSEIADKFNDKKEEYENIKNYLFDILTPLIRDKVFRGITEFDATNYAKDAERDGF